MLTRGTIPSWVISSEFASLNSWNSLGLRSDTRIALLWAIWLVFGVFAWAGVAGLIGMFFLWRPGCFLFLAGVCARVLFPLTLVSWQTKSMWVGLFGELQLLLDGLIIALVFFGPAKALFRKLGAKSI
jgi:hypothetical protein